MKKLSLNCAIIFRNLICFLTEPNAPPFHVQGQSTSSTSILVHWSNAPAADRNGVVLKLQLPTRRYQVAFHKQDCIHYTISQISHKLPHIYQISTTQTKPIGP